MSKIKGHHAKTIASNVQTILTFGASVALISLFLLLLLPRCVSPFDSSHLVQPVQFRPDQQVQHDQRLWSSPTIRWDSIHFKAIAKDGYTFEQQLAFQPGWPKLMAWSGRGLGSLVNWFLHERDSVNYVQNRGEDRMMEVGSLSINLLARVASAIVLYLLTKHLTNSPFAQVTTYIYILNPTPAVLAAPNTEPTYAFFTFTGFYLASISVFYNHRVWICAAAISLAGATVVRSTGVFNVLPLAWLGLFGDKPLNKISLSHTVRRSTITGIACLLTISPFILFQYYAYTSFCSDTQSQRPWCQDSIPFAYSFVQAEYWNVGLFKYWSPAQLPNFIIAGPILFVSLTGTFNYLYSFISNLLTSDSPTNFTKWMIYNNQSLLPFHLHHLFITFLLIFSSHTQIALRVATANPVVWWNVTAMAFDWSDQNGQPKKYDTCGSGTMKGMTRVGKIWVWWSVLWGSISLVLWAGHYPPA